MTGVGIAIRGESKRNAPQMAMARQEDSTVMLSAAKHLDAHPDKPFAAAQGDTRGKQLA